MGIFRKSKSIDYGVINSIIGEDAQFKGEINTKGAIRISGEFEGKINAQSDVLVSEGSKITGNITGKRIIVSGEINGNIVAFGSLEITRNGRVYGDITGERLIVDEGAIYKGRVNMEAFSKKEIESLHLQAESSGVASPASKLYKTAKT